MNPCVRSCLSLVAAVLSNSLSIRMGKTISAVCFLRKLLCCVLAGGLLVSQTAFSVAQAQTVTDDIDFDPPVIDHESLVTGIAGELQVFSALVVDDRGLEEVTLYYRNATGQDYQQIAMQPMSGTDNYTASVDSTPQQEKVEYYIEARDTGGNRVLKGFPFFPLVRTLEAPAPAPVVEQPAPPPPAASTGNRNTTLYVVLGAVALGLLAALAVSGGGGGGGDNGGGAGGGGGESPDSTVPLTINVSPP